MGINRTQGLVLGFFIGSLGALVLISLVTPGVIDAKLPFGDTGVVRLLFLGGLTLFLCVPVIGVIRGWRWTFWLILVSFILGVLRIPASGLELAGILPTTDPPWYVVLQGAIGLLQFGIGVLMLRGYHKGGPWAAF